MAKSLDPQLQRRLVAYLLASLKGKSSVAALGVPASSLYYWRRGTRCMSVDRAHQLLAKLRVPWRTFLSNTKGAKAPNREPATSDEAVAIVAALSQLVSRSLPAEVVVMESTLTEGRAASAALRWASWEVRLTPSPSRVWAQLSKSGMVLMEGAYSPVLWAEFWRAVSVVKSIEQVRHRKQPSTLQLQKRLMRIQSKNGK
jgi:hypothetical protein